MNEPRPSDAVEVTISLGHPNYWAIATEFHGPGTVEWWLQLGDLLGGRPGWHCELTAHGLQWSFGPMGASLFNVTALDNEDEDDYTSNRYEVFDHDADTSHVFTGTAPMLEWLEANEPRHVDHLRNLRAMMAIKDWKVLMGMGLEVRITHDGHTFIAVVPNLVGESTMADDLPTLLTRARELIQHACDAPPEIAPGITITARLDTAATNALT